MKTAGKIRPVKRLMAAAAIALSCAGPASAGREDQWIYRTELGDGTKTQTAVFLSWDYGSVVFRAHCDSDRRELVLTYFADSAGVPLTPKPLILAADTIQASMPTQSTPDGLEGRLAPSDAGYELLEAGGDLTIDAPNEMGEPWYVCRAEPLRRIMNDCVSAGSQQR